MMEAIEFHDISRFKISDQEVVKRVLCGEKRLYELLMRRYNQKLYRLIRSYLTDEYEVEDVMQQTYLKAYENLWQFQGRAQFSTWLVRIGINEALARIREKNKYSTIYDQQEEDKILQISDARQMNPEQDMIQKEAKQLLEKAIDHLPSKYRVVYMLREIEGMSTSEIADCMGISHNNVKVRLHRAKLMLKERLYELSISCEVFAFGFTRCDGMVEKVMKILP